EIDFRRMREDGLVAEGSTLLQQLITDDLRQSRRAVAGLLRAVRGQISGDVVGIDEDHAPRFKEQPVEGALTGAIAAGKNPELFLRWHGSVDHPCRGTNWPSRKRPVSTRPSGWCCSSRPGIERL